MIDGGSRLLIRYQQLGKDMRSQKISLDCIGEIREHVETRFLAAGSIAMSCNDGDYCDGARRKHIESRRAT